MRMFGRVTGVLAISLLSAVASGPAQAQPWPQKTVRFIVPLPPGSGMDLSARIVAERLTERWGQPVVVENRQGGDAIPAVVAFLSARDNHTFLFSFGAVVTFNHLLHERLPVRSQGPGAGRAGDRQLPRRVGVRDAEGEHGRRARRRCKGAARQAQLRCDARAPVYAMFALQRQTGIELANIPYRDFAPAYVDLNAGRLHAASTGVPTLVPHHRAGTAKLRDGHQQRALAAGARRADRARGPNSRTSRSRGCPASSAGATCRPRSKQRVVTDVSTMVRDPAFRERVVAVGTVPRAGTSEDFAAAMEDQRAKIAAIHEAMTKK